jgi:hypothetical protein
MISSFRWVLFVVLIAWCAVPTGTAEATSALRLDDLEQARVSTAVVVATVGVSEPGVHAVWNRPTTLTTVRIEEVLHGRAPATVKIEQLKTDAGGIHGTIPGDAELREGERCVLFLLREGDGWYLTALGQSKLRIVAKEGVDTLVREPGPALFVVDADGRLRSVERSPAASVGTLPALRKLLSAFDSTPRPGVRGKAER